MSRYRVEYKKNKEWVLCGLTFNYGEYHKAEKYAKDVLSDDITKSRVIRISEIRVFSLKPHEVRA